MTMFNTESGGGKYRVTASVFSTGEGLIVHLLGGEKPHVGAVVISVPRPSLTGDGSISCTTSTLPLVGHKDDIAAKPLAEALCKLTKENVVVVSGIHLNHAGPEDIKKLQQHVRSVTEDILQQFNQL